MFAFYKLLTLKSYPLKLAWLNVHFFSHTDICVNIYLERCLKPVWNYMIHMTSNYNN